MKDISMCSLIETVLTHRSERYLSDFLEKLLGEGIAAPKDLLLVSEEALETKLSLHPAFNYIEMADAINLRGVIDRDGKVTKPGRRQSPQNRRVRSRSLIRSNFRVRGRDRQHSGGRGGRCNNSQPHRGNQDTHHQTNNKRREDKVKPDLLGSCGKE